MGLPVPGGRGGGEQRGRVVFHFITGIVPSDRQGPVPAGPGRRLYLAQYEYGITLKMICSDIPLSRLVTSKSLAASGRLPGRARWNRAFPVSSACLGPGPQSPASTSSAAQAPAAPRRRKGHGGHGQKRPLWAGGPGEGLWSPLGQTRHGGRGGAEGERRRLGLFLRAVTSLPRLLPFTLCSSPELSTLQALLILT